MPQNAWRRNQQTKIFYIFFVSARRATLMEPDDSRADAQMISGHDERLMIGGKRRGNLRRTQNNKQTGRRILRQ